MAIQRIGEKLIKRSVFVEKGGYELIVRYSELRNQSISAAFGELVLQSRMYTLGRIEKIEQGKLPIQGAIRKHEAAVSIKGDTKLESKPDQFTGYRAPRQADSLPSESNQF